jgi:hypothetical protein
MRKFSTPTALLVALAAIAFAGCSHKVTVQTSQGTVSVDQGANGSTTIKSNSGEVAIGKGAVDPASLGLPVYPGATQSKDNASVSVSDTSKGGGSQFVILTTTDPFDKVYEYYKGQLPAGSEKMKVSSGDSDVAQFQVGSDKDQKVVMLTGAKDKTTIELTHQTKP